ncbi:MAG TPA: hypothetical protein ENH14_02390 [candidate division WOR-3 bacterium]|uniref:DNA-(apurinic or apyrimidinic site) lyase n=1 Tax=candidate division WOR-3 bacterium TaxID=2052148 RepID=A0A7V0LUQ2_UNCW3|nr:MAG: hypothetical protein DRQ03_03100 [Candidatus Hydrothermae bacterium]HDL60284.1 hypothetical protein [candidate division WOR-3 bacterium]
MAEGPLVHRYTERIKRIAQGKKVTVKFLVKKLKGYNENFHQVVLIRVEAFGKQFRFYFSNKKIVIVHLMMWGYWKFYKRGENWDKPLSKAKMIIHCEDNEIVLFSAPVLKVFDEEEFITSKYNTLGPDPLRPDFSKEKFLSNLLSNPEMEIGEALIRQDIIAGIGNILRIEILFNAKIHPRRKIKDIDDRKLDKLVYWILKLPSDWFFYPSGRKKKFQIYRKAGRPCPRCGTTIEFFRQAGRITYACPQCQK